LTIDINQKYFFNYNQHNRFLLRAESFYKLLTTYLILITIKLLTGLSILHNYFDSSTKFSVQFPVKILDLSTKLFRVFSVARGKMKTSFARNKFTAVRCAKEDSHWFSCVNDDEDEDERNVLSERRPLHREKRFLPRE